MGVGPTGQELEGRLGNVRPQGGDPFGAEDLQQSVEALHAFAATLHQARSDLHRSFERVTGTDAHLGVQALRVQHRQVGQQLRVQTVGLGVLGIIVPQVGGPRGAVGETAGGDKVARQAMSFPPSSHGWIFGDGRRLPRRRGRAPDIRYQGSPTAPTAATSPGS